MVDNDDSPRPADESAPTDEAVAKRTRRRAASRPAGPPAVEPAPAAADTAPPEAKSPAKKAAKKSTTRKPAKKPAGDKDSAATGDQATGDHGTDEPSTETAEPSKPAKRARASKKSAAASGDRAGGAADDSGPTRMATAGFVAPLFVAPEPVGTGDADEPPVAAKRTRRKATPAAQAPEPAPDGPDNEATDADDDEGGDGSRRRRRRRGGRGRKRRSDEDGPADESSDALPDSGPQGAEDEADEGDAAGKRRRRRRRRGADGELEPLSDDAPATTSRSRQPRDRGSDDVTGLRGSTRLEAKKQRRREGREAGRRRAPILTEAEFLARREAVERVMVVRQKGDRTQIAVLEDGVLVEHYVTRGSSSSMVGNVYLGRVQNVLPSMEAAFVDIGRGRNAVLYAGEVNWDAAGLEGQPKRIELALKSGDPILVQVTKDPVGQKGSRLTSQISLPGRFLVYVPDSNMTGISRKLPDTER
ncbi:MAG: ribonuclease E/G, partial [Actinomycetota bacterium]|nr:ribonuclease E/G [Actinomycetota bacterium]